MLKLKKSFKYDGGSNLCLLSKKRYGKLKLKNFAENSICLLFPRKMSKYMYLMYCIPYTRATGLSSSGQPHRFYRNITFKSNLTSYNPHLRGRGTIWCSQLWMAFSPKVPMYKNSETICISYSPKNCLYTYVFKCMKQ